MEDFLGLLQRRIPAVLWTTDRDLRITRCEGGGLAALGLAPGELVGRTVPEYFGGDDPGFPPLAAHRNALEGRGGTFDTEWGGRIWRVGVEPLPGAGGPVEGVIGIAVDVTDALERADDRTRSGLPGPSGDALERHRVEERIRQTQKMDAVGRLAGGVAHDFNNVLTVITGYSDLLLARLDKGSPIRRQVDEIRKASGRATEMTDQLLAFSRRKVLAPRVVDLHGTLAEMDEVLRRLLGEGVRLVVHPGPVPALVRVDPDPFRQVVLNLAANARDAMPLGGTLRIETRHESVPAGQSGAAAVPAGAWVVLEVADDGEGLSPDAREHLFEPFYSTRERGRGAGLGLATVYGVVKQSGGHIEVESAPGTGTRFRIRLPAAQESTEAAPAAAAPALARPGHEVILVVEDEQPIRDLVRGTLEERGYTVLAATDGRHALELLEARKGAVDLLLTDVVMPRMGGGELARAVRERRPGVRVLFISGYTDDLLARHGISEGREAFLRKPFAPEALLKKVREVLGG